MLCVGLCALVNQAKFDCRMDLSQTRRDKMHDELTGTENRKAFASERHTRPTTRHEYYVVEELVGVHILSILLWHQTDKDDP